MALKLRCYHGQLSSFPMVTISIAVGRALCCYDVRNRQVATGNGVSCPWQQHDFGHQTSSAPYSTDNHSLRTVSNRSFLVRSGEFGRSMVRILTRRSRDKYPCRDQISLICRRSVPRKVPLGIYRTQIRPTARYCSHTGSVTQDIRAADTTSDCVIPNFGTVVHW